MQMQIMKNVAFTTMLVCLAIGAGSLLLLGLIWLFFGDDFLSARQLFKRSGFEMPASASHIVVNDQEDAMVIGFRLTPPEAADLVDHSLPGYSGWRQQQAGELLSSLGGMPGSQLHSLMINEKHIGRSLWRILVDLPTGDCFAYYQRNVTP
jgi:hypothetical protein